MSDANTGDDGAVLLLFKSSRTYVVADGTGLFSNPMAEQFVVLYGSGPQRPGTEMRLVQLSGGYKGVLMSGAGSITVQFGNDDVLVQAVAPPGDATSVDRVVALAKAITKEMAESTPPGKTPAEETPPPVATSTVPQVTVPYPKSDPHPATGIDPIPNLTQPPSPITTTTKHPG